jgi:hypothetical protein
MTKKVVQRANPEIRRLHLLRAAFEFVMPGLVPGIHVLFSLKQKNVDGRDEARP